jgi:hypothetical protein
MGESVGTFDGIGEPVGFTPLGAGLGAGESVGNLDGEVDGSADSSKVTAVMIGARLPRRIWRNIWNVFKSERAWTWIETALSTLAVSR